MTETLPNPYAARAGAHHLWEGVVRWIFRLGTYAILASGGAVLLNIVVKGLPALVTTDAPFINTSFLFDAPESLYVFEYQGQHYSATGRFASFARPAAILRSTPRATFIPRAASSPVSSAPCCWWWDR